MSNTSDVSEGVFVVVFFFLIIFLFISGCTGLTAAHRLSLTVVSRADSSLRVCGLLIEVASLVAERGL